MSLPVAVLIGETIARKAAATRLAEAGQAAALAALSKASVTDDLTGLGNRRRANALLDSLADGDAIVILDLDHFKSINDTLGHHRGDQVLQELGAFLLTEVRVADAVARYGGEEFVIVVRASEGGALEVTERVLDRWRAMSPPVTLSAGLAVKRMGRQWTETFADADVALYEAKKAGRDRAVLFVAAEELRPAPEAVRSTSSTER